MISPSPRSSIRQFALTSSPSVGPSPENLKNRFSKGPCRTLNSKLSTNDRLLLLLLWGPQMQVVGQRGRFAHLESSEARVSDELVGRQHFIGSQGDHLAVLVDQMDDSTQSVQFGEIFGLDHEVLPVNADRFLGLPTLLQNDLLVLPSEEARQMFHLGYEFLSGLHKLGEFEVLRAALVKAYLQKYCCLGK